MPRLTTPQTHPSYRITDTRGTSCSKHATCRHPDTAVVVRTQKAPTHDDELTSQISPDHTNRTDVKRKDDEEEMNSLFADNDTVLQLPLTAAPSTSFAFPSHVGPRSDGQSTAEQRLLTPQNTQRRVVRPHTTTVTTTQAPFSSTATATTAIDRNSNNKEKTKDGESTAEGNAVVEAHTTEAEEKTEGEEEEEEEVVDLVQATPQTLRSQKKDSTSETRRKRSGGDDSAVDAPLPAESAPLPLSSSLSTAAVAVMVSSTRREPTHVRQVHFPAATRTPLPLPLSPRNINEEANSSSSSRNRAGTSTVSAASTAGVDTTTNSRVLAAPPHFPFVRLPAAVRDPTLGVAAPPSRAVADAVTPSRLTADPTPITTLKYTDNTEDKSETRRCVSGLTENRHRHIGGDGNGGGVAAAAAQMQTAHVWLPRRVEYLSEAPPQPQSHSRGGGARDGAPYAANQNRTRQEGDGSAIPQSVLWRRRQQESSLSSLSVEVTALHHPDQHQHQQRGRAQDDAEVERTERRDAYQHPSESVAPAPLSAAQWCVTAFESVAVHLFSEHASNSTAQRKTRQAYDAEDHDVSVRGRGGVEATFGVPNSSNDDGTNGDEEKGGVEDDEEGSGTDNSEDVDDTDSESGAAMPTPTAAAHVSSSRAGQRGGTRVLSTLARSHRNFYDTDAASTRGDANGEGDGNEHEDDEEEEAAAAAGVVARSVRRGRGHRRPRSRSRYATSHHRHSNNNNNNDYRDGQPATRRRLDRKESTGRQPACRTRCVDDHNDDGDAECPGNAQPTVHGPPSVAGTLRTSGGGPAACTLQLRITLPWMLHASILPAGVSARLLQCLESHTRATLSGSLCEDLHKNTHAVQPLIDRSVADASGVAADTVGRAAAAAADGGGGGGVCCDAAASPPPFWIAAFAYTHSIQSQATTAAARLVHELEAMTVARSGLSIDHSRRAPHNHDGGVDSALDGTENVARGAQQAQAASAFSPGRTISQQHSRPTLLEHVECVRWPAWVPATHTATLVLAALTSAAFVLINDISLALHRATVKQADGADGHAHVGTSGNERTSRGKADGTPRHTTTLHTAVHAFSGFCAAVFGEEECSRLCRHVRDRLPLHSRELRGMMQLAAPPRPMPGRPDVDGGGVGGCASPSGKTAHGGFTSHGRDAEAAAESSWPSLLDVIHHLARVWMRLCFPKLAARLHSFLVTHNPGVVLDGWWRGQSERSSASCSSSAADAASSAVHNTEAARAGETSSDDLQRRVYDALHWFVFGLLQRWEKWSPLPATHAHTNAAAASAKGLGADVLAGFSPLSPSRSDGVQWRAHVNFGKVQALRWTLHHMWVPYMDTTDDEHVGASRLGLSAEIHSANLNNKQYQQQQQQQQQQLWLSSLMADLGGRTSKLSINTTTRSSTMCAVRVDVMAVLEHLSLLPVLLDTLLLRQEVTSVLQRAITGTQKCDRDNTLSTRLNTFHACFRLFFGVCCYGASLVPLTATEKKTGNASGKEESELTVPSTRTALQTEVVEGVWREWMLPLLVQYVDSDSAIHHYHHHQQQKLSRTSEGADGPADYEALERCHAHSSCPRRVRLLIIAHEMTVYALTLLQLVQEGQRTGSHRHPAATVTTHSRKRTRSAASSTLSDRSHQQRHSHHDRRRFLPVWQPTPTPPQQQQQQQSSLPSASSSRRPQWRPTAIPHNAQRSEDLVGGGGGAHNGGSCCSPYSVSSLTDASATTMTTSVASLRTLVSVSTATTQSVVAPRQTIARAAAASAGAAGGAAVKSIPTPQLQYAWEGRCASPQQKQPQPFHREAEHREEDCQCTEADALSSAAAAAAAMCGGHRFPWVVPSLRSECLGGCSTGSIPGVSSHGASSDKTAPAADWRAVCRAAVRDWLACPAHAAEYTDYAHVTPSHSSARHAGPAAPSVGAAAHTIHRRDVRRLRLFLLTLRECVVRLRDDLQQQQQQTVLSGNKDGTAHPHNNDAEDEGSQINRSTNRSAAAGVDGAKLYDYLYGVLPPHWRGDGGGDDSVLTVVELPSSSSSSSSITALSPSLSDFSMGGDGLRSPQQRRRRRRVHRHGHFNATSSSSLLHRPRGVAGDGGASPTLSSSDTEDNYARQEEEEEGMISDAFSLGLRSAPTNSNGSSSCSNAGNSQADSARQSQ